MFRLLAPILLIALLVPVLFGCVWPLIQMPLYLIAAQNQTERQAGVKVVLGGNAERAVLINLWSYFYVENFDPPVLLDLATGRREVLDVPLIEQAQSGGGYPGGAQTDGDYLVWNPAYHDSTQSAALEVFDLRTSQRSRYWEGLLFDGLEVRDFILSEGRVLVMAFAPDMHTGDASAAPDSIEDPQTPGTYDPGRRHQFNLLLHLSSGELERLPAVPLLGRDRYDREAAIVGDKALVIRQLVTEHWVNQGYYEIPHTTALHEIDLFTGDEQQLALLPAFGDLAGFAAARSALMWLEAGQEAALVRRYDRATGATADLALIDTPGAGNIFGGAAYLLSGSDAGALVAIHGYLGPIFVEFRFIFITADGRSVTLQRERFGILEPPVGGSALIVGNRILWNDPRTGTLRFYVIPTGERGEYPG